MNTLCSNIYRKSCLNVANGLTTKERQAFLFFCSDILPASIADIYDRRDSDCNILEALQALHRQRSFSYNDTSLLKDFLLIQERRDLLKVVEKFDVSRDLIWLLEGLITSRGGTSFCHEEFLCDGIDKVRVNGIAMIIDNMQNLLGEPDELIADTRALFRKAISARVSTETILEDVKSELRSGISDSQPSVWRVIISLIKFTTELAVDVMPLEADKSKTLSLRWEKEVQTMCKFLTEEVVPRITEYGGWVS